jgi:hypothetical protein
LQLWLSRHLCSRPLADLFHNNGYAVESEVAEIRPEVFPAFGHRRAVGSPAAGFDERPAVGSNFPWGQNSVSSSAPNVWSIPNEKPDRYAAAICIRVRRDGFAARIFCWRSCRLSVLKGGTGLRRYPDFMRFRRLLLFLLGCLLCFLCLLRFLGHVPLRGPWSLLNASRHRNALIQNTPQLQN